jgi:ribose transport system permease protein
MTMSENEPVITAEKPPQDLELIFNILMKILPFAFLMIIFAYNAASHDRFTDSRNMQVLLQQATIIAFIAVGITAVMLYGKLDLSAIGLVALTSYIFVEVANEGSTIGGLAVTIIVAGLFGVVHGLLVGGLRTHGALTTLGTAFFANALVLQANEAQVVRMESEPLGIFTGLIGSVPQMLIVLVVLVVMLDGLRFGIKRALAENPPQMPNWVWMLLILVLAYTFSALMTGIGGALLATRLRAASFVGSGMSILFQALAAVVIGGTSPFGKFGWFAGTVAAAIAITALSNGLILNGLEPYRQDLYISGLLILWLCLHAGMKLILDYNKPSTQDS